MMCLPRMIVARRYNGSFVALAATSVDHNPADYDAYLANHKELCGHLILFPGPVINTFRGFLIRELYGNRFLHYIKPGTLDNTV
jgi:hypothetical protein